MKRLIAKANTRGLSIAVVALVLAIGAATAGMAQDNRDDGQVIFNSIPSPLPDDTPSVGVASSYFNELGDGIVIPTGTGGTLKTVTVVLDSWACQKGLWYNPAGTPNACVTQPGATFSWPITMNIYAPGATDSEAGTRLATLTKTFKIPYRPSSVSATQCAKTAPGGDGSGDQWYDSQDKRCYWGITVPITFDFSEERISLPPVGKNEVIITVAYNTSLTGFEPVGTSTKCYTSTAGCPYDSLNVGNYGDLYFYGTLPPSGYTQSWSIASSVFDPNGVFVNWFSTALSCSPSTAVTDVLQVDTPCWTGAHPMFKITACCGGRGQQVCPRAVGTNSGSDTAGLF